MTKYNSSKYRAVPLCEAIEKDISKFDALMEIMNKRGLSVPFRLEYGTHEMRLKPSKEHLVALIGYLTGKDHKSGKCDDENRRKLFCGDDVIREKAKTDAINAIEKNYENLRPAWYVFEGYTCPDLFIEGEDYVVVCECKWTEPHITSETSFLRKSDGESRNQMIRHIQGALGYAKEKQVIAFYIVDENCGYKGDLTIESMKEHIANETIKPENEEAILSAFCGFTTWQMIEAKLGIVFSTKEDIDKRP